MFLTRIEILGQLDSTQLATRVRAHARHGERGTHRDDADKCPLSTECLDKVMRQDVGSLNVDLIVIEPGRRLQVSHGAAAHATRGMGNYIHLAEGVSCLLKDSLDLTLIGDIGSEGERLRDTIAERLDGVGRFLEFRLVAADEDDALGSSKCPCTCDFLNKGYNVSKTMNFTAVGTYIAYTTKTTGSACDQNSLARGLEVWVLGVDGRVHLTAQALGELERGSERVGIHG